jgi:hypothetical protein
MEILSLFRSVDCFNYDGCSVTEPRKFFEPLVDNVEEYESAGVAEVAVEDRDIAQGTYKVRSPTFGSWPAGAPEQTKRSNAKQARNTDKRICLDRFIVKICLRRLVAFIP